MFRRNVRRGLTTQQTVIIVVVVAVVILGCLGAALFTALLLPALAQSQENARQIRSTHQMGLIEQSRQLLLNELEEVPASSAEMLQLLEDRNFVTPDLLISPVGSVTNGGGDYWVNVDPARAEDSPAPESHIAIYDRAMYEQGRRVGLCFYDGECVILDRAAFDALLNDTPNAGTNFNLPVQ